VSDGQRVLAPWSVIVLTGGASTRMGRDKATLQVGGVTLLERTMSGVPTDVAVVIGGPEVSLARSGVQFVSEDPPGGGPVAGVAAALDRVDTPIVVVLATDLPMVGSVPQQLALALADSGDVDGVLAADATGHPQQLCAAYRTDALRRAIAAGGQTSGASMRSVVARLRVRTWTPAASDGRDPVRDIDTPEDLAQLKTGEPVQVSEQQGDTDG
jgi:molybdopterin-guanine dinucleotide biosynthesis protein A